MNQSEAGGEACRTSRDRMQLQLGGVRVGHSHERSAKRRENQPLQPAFEASAEVGTVFTRLKTYDNTPLPAALGGQLQKPGYSLRTQRERFQNRTNERQVFFGVFQQLSTRSFQRRTSK